MNDFEWSQHASEMVKERKLRQEWIIEAISHPESTEDHRDSTHYIKRIPEHGHRYLRVVVNRNSIPKRIVTAFFDRRLNKI
jgi:hypothetical protein